MIAVTDSKYGSVIAGRVVRIKHGTKSAADRLTILKITDVSSGGIPCGNLITILFWNSTRENGPKLSDRARRLHPGDSISARVVFDVGDPNKCTGFELKTSGTYLLTENSGRKSFVVCGTASKVITGKNGYVSICIPVDRWSEGNKITHWYRANFWHSPDIKNTIHKGDFLVVRGDKVTDGSYGRLQWKDITVTRFKNVAKPDNRSVSAS